MWATLPQGSGRARLPLERDKGIAGSRCAGCEDGGVAAVRAGRQGQRPGPQAGVGSRGLTAKKNTAAAPRGATWQWYHTVYGSSVSYSQCCRMKAQRSAAGRRPGWSQASAGSRPGPGLGPGLGSGPVPGSGSVAGEACGQRVGGRSVSTVQQPCYC